MCATDTTRSVDVRSDPTLMTGARRNDDFRSGPIVAMLIHAVTLVVTLAAVKRQTSYAY